MPVGASLTCTLHACNAGKPAHANPLALINLNHLDCPQGTHQPTPWGTSRSPAIFLMTKGIVFEAITAPTSTHAPTVGASMLSGPALVAAPSNPSTSIRPLLLARYLQYHPNHQYVSTLLSHLTYGFDIGYQGPQRDVRAPNLSSASVHPEVIDNHLSKECGAGRMAGPFTTPPFHPFHCSGLGVVPKQDGSWQVITHLSAPDGLSINDHIDPESVILLAILQSTTLWTWHTSCQNRPQKSLSTMPS